MKITVLIFIFIFLFRAACLAATAVIVQPLDHSTLSATSESEIKIGQVLAIRSRTATVGVIGFAKVIFVQKISDQQFELKLEVIRLNRRDLVLPGDLLEGLELSHSGTQNYEGHAELLVREHWRDVSSKYRPLFLQGISIGETAETLGDQEALVGIYGNASYGLTRRISAGALLPGYALQSPNGNIKGKIYQGDSDTVSVGSTVTKIRDSDSTAVNVSLFWDAVTSDHLVSHTLVTFAAATLQKEDDTVAIKTAGTSSLQTGYEIILTNWDRVLFGPSYNFELKTVGGYAAYTRIWDHLHVSAFLSTVDVRNLKYAPQTGYVGLVEAYWRF